jgi:hypothetical protein
MALQQTMPYNGYMPMMGGSSYMGIPNSYQAAYLQQQQGQNYILNQNLIRQAQQQQQNLQGFSQNGNNTNNYRR